MKTDVISSKSAILPLTKAEKLDTNREAIQAYLIAGGEGYELSEKQSELLQRWEFADEMIRTNMGKLSRSEVANLVVSKWKVSLCTAKADMVAAEEVFSSSSPINKKHRMQLRVEFLEKQSRLAAAANDHKAVAMIEKSIAFYLDKYPEITIAQASQPVTFILMNGKDIVDDILTFEDAEFTLEEALKLLPDDGE